MPVDWGLARDYAARDGYPEETRVIEAEWRAATDPGLMLRSIRAGSRSASSDFVPSHVVDASIIY
jgi:hypothetical protein